MVLAKTGICEFGWKARDFALRGVDGKTYTLADVRGRKGTLVAFMCNHCPYVRAVIGRIVAEANALRPIGIGTIAIMPNDTNAYPEDSFDNMKVFAVKHGFTFPYVLDATQEVAKAYRAQCTPDFFGFNAQDELQYRGRTRCLAHEPRPQCPARAVRGHAASRRERARASGATALDGLLHQVEGLSRRCENSMCARSWPARRRRTRRSR